MICYSYAKNSYWMHAMLNSLLKAYLLSDEIRQLSGAMIRISNCEDRDLMAGNSGGAFGNLDRTITITGNAESVALAQYLINMR